MMQFKAFKPEGMNKIAQAMGYSGNMDDFQKYIEQDPARQQQMNMYTNAARRMAQGGMVQKFANGGFASFAPGNVTVGNAAVTAAQQAVTQAEQALASIDAQVAALLAQAKGEAEDPSKITQTKSYSRAAAVSRGKGQLQQQLASAQAGLQQAQAAAAAAAPPATQPTTTTTGGTPIQTGPLNTTPNPNTNPVTPTMQNAQIQGLQNQIASLQAQAQGAVGNAATQLTSQIAGLQSQLAGIQGGTTGGTVSGTGTVAGVPVSGTVTGSPTGVAGSGTVAGVPVSGSVGTTPQAPSVATTGATGQQGTPIATTPSTQAGQPIIQPYSVQQMFSPGVPVGGETVAQQTITDSSQDVSAGIGGLTGQVATPTAMATTGQAQLPTAMQANTMTAAQSASAVGAALATTQAEQTDPVDPRTQVAAAQQTVSSVGNLQAAQGNATLINNPVQRQIQAGELVTGTGVDATAAAQVTAQTQAAAATANPSQQALVQDQLGQLMTQFQGANPPAWASGAIRTANAQMAARGLGASSLAGQAVVQAAMESALPIAMADAKTIASFEAQNLSNRQQSAMLAAEQRAKFMGQEFDQMFQLKVMNASKISDIANQNFTAEQQVQLENSRAVNTMNLNNLSNNQALIMSNASALAQLDVSNLNNRQQAAVNNAQSFLQIDMANLSNRQQTELFKAQQRTQALFTDTAAQNATRQFNATSQNQVEQFFKNLSTQVAQFNATQQNAQAQFNSGQTNTLARFNAELNNQRDQFNAQNQLVIAQSNAQWRRQIATADTAAINRTNELNASAILDISKTAYDNLWNFYADTMEWAVTAAENSQDRVVDMAIAELDAKTRKEVADEQSSSTNGQAVGGLIGTVLGAGIQHGFGNIFGCWVAREVYGNGDARWFVFRTWLRYDAPKWLQYLYGKYGQSYAKFIQNKPALKWLTKKAMDFVVERKRVKQNAFV